MIPARFIALSLLLPNLGWITPAAAQDGFACEGEAVCRFEDTRLPVRVLMRPARAVVDGPSAEATVLRSNLPAFRPWYVFDAEGVDLSDPDDPKGWFQIGPTSDEPYGWIGAGDVVLWKSAIVVTYTNRGSGAEEDKRSRVLMFGELDELKAMMEAPDPAAESDRINAAIDSGDIGEAQEAGVVMAEPRRFVDFKGGFYILPVVDFETFDIGFDSQGRYLRLAAAVPQSEEGLAARTTLTDEGTRESIAATESALTQGSAALGVDIKFVIDMTGSMQPYLDATQEAVNRIVGEIARIGLDDEAVRYGLIGYTDIAAECSDCNFPIARSFTPELVPGAALVEILRNDRAARAVGGGDWRETVYAGVEEAIQGAWRPNSIRFVVLIGDALARESGLQAGANASAEAVRSLANDAAGDRTVFVLALHARPTQISASENQVAEAQFRTLARNPATQSDSYVGFDVDVDDPQDIENKFIESVFELSDALASAVARVRGGDVSALAEAPAAAGDSASDPAAATRAVAEEAASAALVEYLGSAAVRPNDLTAWAADADPRDPLRSAMEVRVLLEKRELADLIETMEELLKAYRTAEKIGSDFFSELRATMTSSVSDDGSTARDAELLVGADLVPSWLDALPYKSALMTLTPETFNNMTPDDRAAFEFGLEDKLYLLTDYLNDPDVWVKLSPDSADLASVFPVPLTDLP